MLRRRSLGLIGVIALVMLLGFTLSGKAYAINSSALTLQERLAADSEKKGKILSHPSFEVSLDSFSNKKPISVDINDLREDPHKSPSAFKAAMNYTLHAPIEVTNDIALAEVAINGTGTQADPYVLAGWKCGQEDMFLEKQRLLTSIR